MSSKTKRNEPLVSVVMPVYNAREFLAEAIESILSQTYKNFELLIVDDGSTDDSWEMIGKYARRYPKKIKTLRLKSRTNEAGNGAVNAILPKARGEYIARMDADDVAHPKRLEKQVAFLEKNSQVILVGTQARVTDARGRVTGKKTYPLSHDEIYKQYAVVHPIIHPSVMIRRSMLPNKNRLYELKYGVNDDYYTFFRLMNYGEFANLSGRLLDYRVHGSNVSLVNLKKQYKNIARIRKAAQKDFGYKVPVKARLVMFLQDLIVGVVPEKLLTGAYLFLRGMSSGGLGVLSARIKSEIGSVVSLARYGLSMR